ncbi:hypothetical protein E2C01_057573 [Portunus trituberculatus]|uniref:Uncharacterized protein n=1 Tax=Portunus trituberculatus TaxID=210409 RepID=A0A5B7H3Q4_PORTR|nr:hypothetical protein [Portunus trituberculatus]
MLLLLLLLVTYHHHHHHHRHHRRRRHHHLSHAQTHAAKQPLAPLPLEIPLITLDTLVNKFIKAENKLQNTAPAAAAPPRPAIAPACPVPSCPTPPLAIGCLASIINP